MSEAKERVVLPEELGGEKIVTPSMVTWVTPKLAEKLLKRNPNFRSMRPGLIQKYAGEMKESKWILNGAPIIFNGDGELVDGQHRLAACVEAGVKFPTIIYCGGSALGIDENFVRTLNQWLQFRGEKNANSLASIVNFVYQYKDLAPTFSPVAELRRKGPIAPTISKRSNGQRPSTQELLEYFDRHAKAFRNVTQKAIRSKPPGLIEPKLVGGLYYLFCEKDTTIAAQYLMGLFGEMKLDQDDPVSQLREKLLRNLSKRTEKMSFGQKMGLSIKAWNMWCRGERRSLMFRVSGPNPESTPKILSPES